MSLCECVGKSFETVVIKPEYNTPLAIHKYLRVIALESPKYLVHSTKNALKYGCLCYREILKELIKIIICEYKVNCTTGVIKCVPKTITYKGWLLTLV